MSLANVFGRVKQNNLNMEISVQMLLSQVHFLSVGKIVKVLDNSTVYVEKLVSRNSVQAELCTVKLVHFLSQLEGKSVEPLKGDLVLIFFLDEYHPEMLESKESLYAPDAPSNSKYSGIGVLIGTSKNTSAFHTSVWREGDRVFAEKTFIGRLLQVFKDSITFVFGSREKTTHNISFGENDHLSLSFESGIKVVSSEESPIEVSSDDSFTAHFKKAVIVETEEGFTLKASGDISLEGRNLEVKAESIVLDSNKISFITPDSALWQPNIVPTCPFGIPHGGTTAGITLLKGSK